LSKKPLDKLRQWKSIKFKRIDSLKCKKGKHMTKRERVIAALQHRETDFIPYSLSFTQGARDKMVQFYGSGSFAEGTGDHITMMDYSGGGRPLLQKEGYFSDDFGVVWNRTVDKDIGVIEGFQISGPDMSSYSFPEVPEALIRKQCEECLANAGDRFSFASLGFSLFERAWTLTGMENLLIYMVTEPDFVTGLFDRITGFNMQVIDIFLDYGFDGIHFGDDWGQQQGLIMGPALWRKFVKPQLAKMYGAVKERNLFVSQHSCGDINDVLPDLIEVGLDVYQTFQPEIYDIQSVKALYGGRLSFWGGISTQRLLPFATPGELIEKASDIMRLAGKGGGFIAGPTHAIPGDVPAENIDALIRLFKDQARYMP
jgi:uroporphyrinogen decarboxylase